MKDTIESLFPREEEIPQKYRIDSPVCQNYYLVNGELRSWDGPLQEVLSPVWVKMARVLPGHWWVIIPSLAGKRLARHSKLQFVPMIMAEACGRPCRWVKESSVCNDLPVPCWPNGSRS